MKVTTKTSLCKWKDGKMLIAFFHAVLSTKAEPDLVTVKPNAEIICWDHPTPPPSQLSGPRGSSKVQVAADLALQFVK